MYTSFFGLHEKPFAITPDPRFLYLSERHAEALAHLLYGINESGGFIQLTGEVGTGKTTLVRSLLEQLPEHAEAALILNPRLSPLEFLQTICEELKVEPSAARDSPKALVDALNRYLLDAHARGERVVLIVDEAQNLSADVLEQVRLLTNLETAKQKLLQIILIGQPELRDLLDRQELRQLAQRITGRYHLEPLTRAETGGYVLHRLQVAGGTGRIFTAGALREIRRLSNGIPRIINVICDRSLLGAYTLDQPQVNGALARQAAAEVFGRRISPLWLRWITGGLAVTGVALLAVGLWQFGTSTEARDASAAAVRNPAAAAQAPAAEVQTTPIALPPADAAAKAPPSNAAGVPAVANDGQTQPAAPESADLAELLESRVAATGTDDAFADLFALWGASYRRGESRPCEQSLEAGLHCLYQKGTLAELRVLDHPAILSLRSPSGVEQQVVLAGLGDERATLRMGGETEEVALGDLSRYWFGDYLLLWRPPTEAIRTVSQGSRDIAVAWLRQGLAQLDGQDADASDPELFDAALAERVRRFQRHQQLDVDGIAGVRTQLVLAARLDTPGTPSLIEDEGP